MGWEKQQDTREIEQYSKGEEEQQSVKGKEQGERQKWRFNEECIKEERYIYRGGYIDIYIEERVDSTKVEKIGNEKSKYEVTEEMKTEVKKIKQRLEEQDKRNRRNNIMIKGIRGIRS